MSRTEELRFERDVIFMECENSIFIRPIGLTDFILAVAVFGIIGTYPFSLASTVKGAN